MRNIVLYNGIEIPAIGYGTPISLRYKYDKCWNKKTMYKYWVKNMLKNRKQFAVDFSMPRILRHLPEYALIDTSRAYAGSEFLIGKELRKRNRKSLFITTKLCNADQYEGNIRRAFETSLKELNTDYVDLYLIHWPITDMWLKSWEAIEKLYEEGLCKAIGVCNCNIGHLEKLKNKANIMPMVNQFECHPLFTQDALRHYCSEQNIQIMAYTSTGRMDERINNTCIPDISRKYGKSVAQTIIRWHTQIGNIPIVNTSNIEHLNANFDVFDFTLTNEEVELITRCNINSRLRYDPENCNFHKL